MIQLTLLLHLLALGQESLFGEARVAGLVSGVGSEISGMVASRRQPDVLWVHNDSGSGPLIFAINTSGQRLGTYKLIGARARDWEDMALGPGPRPGVTYLYVADVGNNRAHTGKPHKSVTLYRVPEPDVEAGETRDLGGVENLSLVYPDGAHDVEAVLVDPRDGGLYLFTKRDPRARVYHLPPVSGAGTHTLNFLGTIGLTTLTAADISADGSRILLKDYAAVWFFQRPAGMPLFQALAHPQQVTSYVVEPQGEALAFDARGMGFYTLSEAQKRKTVPLYYYPARGQ